LGFDRDTVIWLALLVLAVVAGVVVGELAYRRIGRRIWRRQDCAFYYTPSGVQTVISDDDPG
jgi:hypothetical protein